MSDPIAPALTAEEWADVERQRRIGLAPNGYRNLDDPATAAEAIAIGNAALPDSDPRKITRETVARLRQIATENDTAFFDGVGILHGLADALESYLPPE